MFYCRLGFSGGGCVATNEINMERREIRSYVIREGRMTPGQKKALEDFWPVYGLDIEAGKISSKIFGADQPLVVEVGFGMGDSLFEMVSQTPDQNFIGIEVHKPGVGHLLKLAGEHGLENLKVFRADSIDVFEQAIPDRSLDKVQIFFPDPWHKKKHHKRRLINPDFAALLARKIKSGGIVHIATDWEPYAEVIREVFASWQPCEVPPRVTTKYERRGLKLDHRVTDLAYQVS